MGKTSAAEGFDEFAASVADASVCDEIKEVAELYAGAKKAMIVYQQNVISVEAAAILADMAVLTGHIGAPRDGILMVKAKNNSQGLNDLGVFAGAESMDGVKGLLVFGEDPVAAGYDVSGLEFLAVCDIYMTETAEQADVFLPGTGSISANGTYINTERRMMAVEAVCEEEVEYNNWQIAEKIANIFDEDFGFEEEADIADDMDDILPLYKYAEIDEILGGVLVPEDPKLVAVADAKLVDELPCTDALMNMMADRLPEVVKATE